LKLNLNATVLFNKHYFDDKIKDVMSWTCRTHREKYKFSSEKPDIWRDLGNRDENVDWNHLARDKAQWQPLVNRGISIWAP
jgi:hypothetical protein